MKEILEVVNGKVTRTFKTMAALRESNLNYVYVNQCVNFKREEYKGKQYVRAESFDKLKKIEKKQRLINCYNENMELVKQYTEMKDVEYDGFCRRTVWKRLNRKAYCVKHGGYIWSYEDEISLMEECLNRKTKKKTPIKVAMLEDGKVIYTFKSINDAKRNGYYDRGISNSIKNNIPYLDYDWKYII